MVLDIAECYVYFHLTISLDPYKANPNIYRLFPKNAVWSHGTLTFMLFQCYAMIVLTISIQANYYQYNNYSEQYSPIHWIFFFLFSYNVIREVFAFRFR